MSPVGSTSVLTSTSTPLLASAMSDNATLVLLTVAGAAPVVLVGAWLTRRRGGDRAGSQAIVVALAPVMATWVGALVAARAMFISPHDLTALTLIALTAGIVGVLTAWRLASRIRRDADALAEMSRSIASGATPDSPDAGVSELRELGEQLSKMSQELNASQDREVRLERSRRELVAWVSHDLRSPLAGIRAMAEAIEDGVVDDPDDVARYLRSIGHETDRLTLLVDDLFELSRIAAGVIELHPVEVTAAELVGPVLDAVHPRATTRAICVVGEFGSDPTLLVSNAEATRVLRNVVDNALRHTPDGGTVTVTVEAGSERATVAVRDQCGGIPERDLERVFDVAFRGDSARARDHSGGGLGLAIAKGLTEAQSGTIAVSNQDDGCCFRVNFALAQDPGPTGATCP